ncbi:MAG: hypothetical protein ACWGNK_06405 [Desulfobacterales bacterium]
MTSKKIIITVAVIAMVGFVVSAFTRWGRGVCGQHGGNWHRMGRVGPGCAYG